MSEQHVTHSHQEEAMKWVWSRTSRVTSRSRAGGAASGPCHGILCVSRKPRDALHIMFLPWNRRTGSDRETFYPSIKTEHSAWTLNAHLWHKGISILCLYKAKTSSLCDSISHLTGILFCLKPKHCPFEKKSTVVYRIPI